MEGVHPAFTLVLALAVGVFAQSLARHLRVPGIVLLLVAGASLGPDGLGWVRPRELGDGLVPIVELAVAVILFAYSTMISWSYYGERCWAWMFGDNSSTVYRIIFLVFVFLGSVVTATNVLEFGDLMILGMALPNILGIYFLTGKVRSSLDDYWGKLQRGEFPTFK